MLESSIKCINCGRHYPDIGNPYRCTFCGGLFDYKDPIIYASPKMDEFHPGIWRYKRSFIIQDEVIPVSLGEGNTPLIWTEISGLQLALKCEYLNPTGSFKDRGSSLIVSILKYKKVQNLIEDSSGNAGASLSAYCARADIKLSVVIPEHSSSIKRKQIQAFGAKIIPVEGTRSEVTASAKEIAATGVVYASHAYLPYNIPGYATISYEIYEQLGQKAPGTVIIPVGQGGLLIGIVRGFKALLEAGKIKKIPSIVGVQARACAPLWSIYSGGIDGLRFSSDRPTLAEGVRVWQPIRGDSVLKELGYSSGKMVAVDEKEILEGIDQFASRGFHIEPTSALIWSAFNQCANDCPGPIVGILTGSGLKYRAVSLENRRKD
jgi:threonine synthase